ncbi:MAG: S41 family peptidase [Proteobacteria bacterium]|nr:S41 family peptidase [Pseudomonadota bacterium]
MKSSHAGSWTTLAVGILIGLSLGVGAAVRAGRLPPGADTHLLVEVLDRVKQEYVDPVDDHRLMTAAIHGMVSSLDPNSQVLEGEEYQDIRITSTGEYSGVGLELSVQDDAIQVIAPIDGGSAAAAGIRAGDVIISIDGVPADSTSLDSVIRRMRGPDGSEVRLGIERENVAEPMEFRLKRGRIALHSVRWQMAGPDIGYARISQFSDSTAADLEKGIADMRAKHGGAPLRGLVLDLRNNPGGVLEAAVAVADEFLDRGTIVTASGRTGDSRFRMDATPGDDLSGAPIVVLVNAGTASASEIVAGALKDNHRAILVGRRTFGKGTVQTVIPLSGNRALKLTTSRYFTPSGLSIDHKGIEPDVPVERDPNSAIEAGSVDSLPITADEEIKRALRVLHERGSGPAGTGSQS